MNLDPELALITWLDDQLGTRGVTELPADLADAMPLYQLAHIGGADLQPSLADLTIDIDYYAGSKADASALARHGHRVVRYTLTGQTLTTPDGASAVVVRVSPSFLPRPDDDYGNPAVHRYLSSYGISFKMRAAATT